MVIVREDNCVNRVRSQDGGCGIYGGRSGAAQSSFPSANFHSANCCVFINHQIIGDYE
jgi:hypothetical protein